MKIKNTDILFYNANLNPNLYPNSAGVSEQIIHFSVSLKQSFQYFFIGVLTSLLPWGMITSFHNFLQISALCDNLLHHSTIHHMLPTMITTTEYTFWALYFCTTHSTYKGTYPFQTGPMQKLKKKNHQKSLLWSFYRSQKPWKHQFCWPIFCPTCKIVFLFGLLQTIQIKIKISQISVLIIQDSSFSGKLVPWTWILRFF